MVRTEQYGITRAKGILFGDDYWGTVIGEEMPYKNEKGIEMKKYLVNPSPQLMGAYPDLQREGALPYRNFARWVEYPTYWISDENTSRSNSIARIFCTFDGRETPLTKRNLKYTNEINLLQQEVDHAKITILVQQEEIKSLEGELLNKMRRIKELMEMMKIGRATQGEIPEEAAE